MGYRLTPLDEGPIIVITPPMIVVGRHPQCDTRLDSLRVSRHHGTLAPVAEGVEFRDLGSTNGMRLNGQRMARGLARLGDELSFAHIRYCVESDGVPNNAPQPSAGDRAPAEAGLSPAAMATNPMAQIVVLVTVPPDAPMPSADEQPPANPAGESDSRPA